jgi:glycosyltransferase involved in cell wall biosynthesis
MKVLILCSGNNGNISSFVHEQGESINKKGVEVDFFLIFGKGYKGYLKNLSRLNNKISSFKPDLIHAHYGLTALLANLQRRVPVISTFHGSDIWIFRKNLTLSRIAHLLSRRTIVVDAKMSKMLRFSRKITVIPCGVDQDIFFNVDQELAKCEMRLPSNKINVLFSSKFDYYEKNYPLARRTMDILGERFNLIELRNYSRAEVNLLLNACDVALMTSISEGSPQFIKEAMLCNCPIVSTNVGDVSDVIGKTEGCFITTYEPEDIAAKINSAMTFRKESVFTTGRERIIKLCLDSESIADKIIEEYYKILKTTH